MPTPARVPRSQDRQHQEGDEGPDRRTHGRGQAAQNSAPLAHRAEKETDQERHDQPPGDGPEALARQAFRGSDIRCVTPQHLIGGDHQGNLAVDDDELRQVDADQQEGEPSDDGPQAVGIQQEHGRQRTLD